MSRVMAEGFDALFAAGLRDIFGAGVVELCRPGAVGVAARLDRCLPDVVLLNAACAATPEAVGDIVRRHPSVTVITCSANEPFMHVYPPFHQGEWYRAMLDPGEIRRYLQS